MKVRLITDSACDLSIDYVQENNIEVVPLTVNINGEFIPDDLGQTLKHEDFYKMIKEGAMPSTAQVNVGDFLEVFKKCVDQGDAII
ncbi:fatty acid-binding protein DegV, partial [Clostridium perfringens]